MSLWMDLDELEINNIGQIIDLDFERDDRIHER